KQLGGRCRLIKDVDGVYDGDPATHQHARRYETISVSHACHIAGRLIQPSALTFADSEGISVEVSTLADPNATLVSAGPSSFADRSPKPPLGIALLGLGTVGLGVYRELCRRPDLFTVEKIAVCNPDRHASNAPAHLLTTDCWHAIE